MNGYLVQITQRDQSRSFIEAETKEFALGEARAIHLDTVHSISILDPNVPEYSKMPTLAKFSSSMTNEEILAEVDKFMGEDVD